MMKAPVRDLRYRFPEIENRLQEGEEVQITKRKRVIARLVPERPAAPLALPDFRTMVLRADCSYTFDRAQAKLARAAGLATPAGIR